MRGRTPVPMRQQIAIVADKVRRTLSKVDDAEVRKGRRLARLSRADKLDVVYFGDSTTSFFSLDDQDRRPVHRMIRDLLPAQTRMHTVHGGSYSPPLYAAYLRLIEASPSRPVIILPLCIRVRTVPWMEHPIHGRRDAIDFLSNLDPATPARRIHKGFPPAPASAWSQFESLPHPTWAGDWTVGDYLTRLTKSGETDDSWVKLLYAYHHGGKIPQGQALQDVQDLASSLKRLGVPVVAYQTPVPVEQGETYYPGFRALAQQNFDALEEAFRTGYGSEATVLQTGMVSGTEEFIDYRDASEHVNQMGRTRLSEAIATATGRELRGSS